MARPNPGIFSGSPFVRWTIVSLTVLTGLVLASDFPKRSLPDALILAGVEFFLLLIALAIGWPARFHWAGRVLGALIFVGYVWYLIDELRHHPETLLPDPSKSGPAAWKALLWLILVGLPALSYAVRGRFGFGENGASDEDAPHEPH